MRWLETRVPPPIVMLTMAAIALGIAHLGPGYRACSPYANGAAALLCLTGLSLNLIPKLAFRKVGTTVNPLRPGAATCLITTGIYRHTRNPMYLGYALLLSGWVAHLGSVAALTVVPVFVLYITRFQIRPEEAALARKFPHWESFRRHSPRWI